MKLDCSGPGCPKFLYAPSESQDLLSSIAQKEGWILNISQSPAPRPLLILGFCSEACSKAWLDQTCVALSGMVEHLTLAPEANSPAIYQLQPHVRFRQQQIKKVGGELDEWETSDAFAAGTSLATIMTQLLNSPRLRRVGITAGNVPAVHLQRSTSQFIPHPLSPRQWFDELSRELDLWWCLDERLQLHFQEWGVQVSGWLAAGPVTLPRLADPRLPVLRPKGATFIPIFLNGECYEAHSEELSFSQAVFLALGEKRPPFIRRVDMRAIVTYWAGPAENPEGSLCFGGIIKITAGMRFQVIHPTQV